MSGGGGGGGGAAGCQAEGTNQGGNCSVGAPGAASAAAAAAGAAAAARPPRDATLKALRTPVGPAGVEPRTMAEMIRGCCRSGSSRGTSVAPPHCCGFALA